MNNLPDIDYSKYLDLLNVKIEEEMIEKICCGNKELREDTAQDFQVCVNCGVIFPPTEEVEFNNVKNPKYQLSTKMGYAPGSKYSRLSRLHKWCNYDYKENTANKTYIEIEKLGRKLELNTLIIADACNVYKTIYIDDEISCRDKIRICMYIYCLYVSALNSGYSFSIFNVLRNTQLYAHLLTNEKDNKVKKKKELTIENFNKATEKVKKHDYANKVLLNDDMEKIYNTTMKEHYENIPSMDEFIKKYNEIFAILQTKTKRLNKNTALLLSVYKLLEITNKKQFLKLYNISEGTLNKFLKILT